MNDAHLRLAAQERFNRSRWRAQLDNLLSFVSGQNKDLIPYEEVASRLKMRQQVEKGTESVPLKQIVGSVGRYRDFTRSFLPRQNSSRERWTRVDAGMHGMAGLPPIELIRVGEVYFVRDGNHRVSVARANGLTHIEAYVTEMKTPIPLTTDDFERDRWLLKIEHAEFLRDTNLDQLCSGHNIELTEPGNYGTLLEHIRVHKYFLDLERLHAGEPEIEWDEAVMSWYDTVYLPVVDAIHRHGLLRNFPNRTEADLYLWIARHREELAEQNALAPLSPETSVNTFAQVHGGSGLQRTVRSVRTGLRRSLGMKPLGISDEEFDQSRARHQAGELSVSEAERASHGVYNGNGSSHNSSS